MNILTNYQILPNCNTYFNKRTKRKAITCAPSTTCFFNSVDFYNKNLTNTTFKSSLSYLQLKAAAEKIFDRSIVFGPNEYKKLSGSELSILRDYQQYFLSDKSINSVFEFITKFGKYFSEHLHNMYPNGFTFVSVGRSPAFLAKYMEFQGEDVKYCPISNISFGFSPESFSPQFIKAYKKYLDSIGLTKESINAAQKPVIFADYNYKGFSLKNFKKLLGLPEIGIYEREKVKFSPLTVCPRFNQEDCIFNHDPYGNCASKTDKWNFDDKFYIKNMEYETTKWYSSIPYLDVRNFGVYEEDTLNRYYQNGNKFAEKFYIKMMNFLIADNILK